MKAEILLVNMNTTDILQVLQDVKDFGGVRPSDMLQNCEVNKFYIVNTDPSTKPGQHWVAVYLKRGCCEFFDSLGQAPAQYSKNFNDLLFIHGPSYMYTNYRLQNYGSSVCGQYCIFYIMMRSQGYSLYNIVNFFNTHSLKFNDSVVLHFYQNIFKTANKFSFYP